MKDTKRKWRAANPEKVKEQRRASAKKHPETGKRWYEQNRERLLPEARERTRRWAKDHPDQDRANRERWKREHPDEWREFMRLGQHRYRARKAAAPTINFSLSDLAARLSMFSGCWVCGGAADSIDHVKPLAKGGAHALANLRPICGPCNSRKRDRWPFDVSTFDGAAV